MGGQALAVNADLKDDVALPDGTNLAIRYLQFGHDDGIDIKGVGDLPGNLDSEVGIFRYVHYTSILGTTIDPQFLISVGTINSVNMGGETFPPRWASATPSLP